MGDDGRPGPSGLSSILDRMDLSTAGPGGGAERAGGPPGLLEEGGCYSLPLLALEGVVLLPGCRLPLLLHAPSDLLKLQRVMRAQEQEGRQQRGVQGAATGLLAVTHVDSASRATCLVGCTARVSSLVRHGGAGQQQREQLQQQGGQLQRERERLQREGEQRQQQRQQHHDGQQQQQHQRVEEEAQPRPQHMPQGDAPGGLQHSSQPGAAAEREQQGQQQRLGGPAESAPDAVVRSVSESEEQEVGAGSDEDSELDTDADGDQRTGGSSPVGGGGGDAAAAAAGGAPLDGGVVAVVVLGVQRVVLDAGSLGDSFRVGCRVMAEGRAEPPPRQVMSGSAFWAAWAVRPLNAPWLAALALRQAACVAQLPHVSRWCPLRGPRQPADVVRCSYLLAAALPLREEQRQQLLECCDAAARLLLLLRWLKRLGALSCSACGARVSHCRWAAVPPQGPTATPGPLPHNGCTPAGGSSGAPPSCPPSTHGCGRDSVLLSRVENQTLIHHHLQQQQLPQAGSPRPCCWSGFACTAAAHCATCGQRLGWRFQQAPAPHHHRKLPTTTTATTEFWELQRSAIACPGLLRSGSAARSRHRPAALPRQQHHHQQQQHNQQQQQRASETQQGQQHSASPRPWQAEAEAVSLQETARREGGREAAAGAAAADLETRVEGDGSSSSSGEYEGVGGGWDDEVDDNSDSAGTHTGSLEGDSSNYEVDEGEEAEGDSDDDR